VSETHIPGECITFGGRYMRQRCEWCGKTLLDYDLTLVQVEIVPGEEPRGPGQYPPGALVRFDGNASYTVNPDELGQDDAGHVLTPDDACTRLDPAVTA
jgi:hypothetical protein